MSEKRSMNSKAQELSIGTLVLIVLGVIILVLIILGFTMGWNNLLEKINIFNPASNIDNVVSACNTAAVANQKDAYCNEWRKTKVSDGTTKWINCQYSDVQTRLEQKLDCEVEETTAARNKCISMIQAKKSDDKTVINNLNCKTSISCTVGGGEFLAKESCLGSDITNKVSVDPTQTGKICCYPATQKQTCEQLGGSVVTLAPGANPPVTGCPPGKPAISGASDADGTAQICCTK